MVDEKKKKLTISLRLHKKETRRYDDVLKPEYRDGNSKNNEIMTVKNLPRSLFNGKAYLITNQKRVPVWKEEFDYLTGRKFKIEENTSSKALIVFKVKGSDGNEYFMSLSFGYGSSMIDNSSIDSDFGTVIASKLLNRDSITSVNTIKVGSNTVQNQKQYVDANQEGINGLINDNSEFSSSVTGTVKNGSIDSKITSSNGLLKSARFLDYADIFYDAKYYLNIYLNDAPRKEWMSKLIKVGDKSIKDELLTCLVNKIIKGNYDYSIAWPTYIDIDDLSIVDLSKKMPSSITEPVDQLEWYINKKRNKAGITNLVINAIKNRHVSVKNESGDELKKTIFACLIAELTYKKKKYILINGDWLEASDKFYKFVEDTLNDIDDIDLGLPKSHYKEKETDYNKRATEKIGGQELHLTSYRNQSMGNGPIEPADIVTHNREFLYVKKGDSSAELSHLFKQSIVAASLLSNGVDDDFRNLILEETNYGSDFLDDNVNNNMITIVFVIIRNKHELPFFSKISLMETIGSLKSMNYKFGITWVDTDEKILKDK